MTRDQLERVIPCPRTVRHRGCCTLHRKRLDLIEDYLFIRGDRMPAAKAAERLGVSARSVQRYRKLLREVTS